MSNDILRPDENILQAWDGTGFQRIDDVVVQPDAGDGDVIRAEDNDDNETETYGFAAPEVLGAVERVDLWALGRRKGATGTMAFRLRIGGAPTATQNIVFTTSSTWHTLSWFGSWQAIDFTGLEVDLTSPSLAKDEWIEIDVLYAELVGIMPAPAVIARAAAVGTSGARNLTLQPTTPLAAVPSAAPVAAMGGFTHV